MKNELNFYTLLDLPSTKETVEFLVHNQSEVTFKINSLHLKTKILSQKNAQQFSVYKFNFVQYTQEAVTCSFEISAEKYFFKSHVSTVATDLLLAIPTEIFKLQRRNDFRVSVPASIPYTCEIIGIKSSPVKLKAELRDLSLGGCLLSVKITGTSFQDGDELYLKLKLNSFDWDRIHCSCKRVVSKELDSKLSVGLKFLETSAAFATDLQSLLVQLDRIHRGNSYD